MKPFKLPLYLNLTILSTILPAFVKIPARMGRPPRKAKATEEQGLLLEEDEDEDEEGAGKSDGLDVLNAQDVSYSIRRLVRGLASPRESSRLGFAVALTEVSCYIHPLSSDG